jgi:hypothetical protein
MTYILICYCLFWFHFIHTSCIIFKPSHSQDTMEALVVKPGVEGKDSKTPTEAVFDTPVLPRVFPQC